MALATELTAELIREGIVRDFVRQVQQLRKDNDLQIEDRIDIHFVSKDATVTQAIDEWKDYIAAETLATSIVNAPSSSNGAKSVAVGETDIEVAIQKR